MAARVAETRWHPAQETERQADGSLVWSAAVSGLHEVRIWILGWGADAEVLEPADAAGVHRRRSWPGPRNATADDNPWWSGWVRG